MYLARELDGDLWLHELRPEKEENSWVSQGDAMFIREGYDWITFENSPIQVDLVIDLEKIKEEQFEAGYKLAEIELS